VLARFFVCDVNLCATTGKMSPPYQTSPTLG
jgi:hypothetical protein